MSKKDSNNEDEVKELAEIYAVLKQDAKSIITDLEGGVAMWREAAAGAVTAVGFIAIISLTFFKNSPPLGIVGWGTLIFFLIIAAAMGYFAVFGFYKYFQLRKKYSGLFARARNL